MARDTVWLGYHADMLLQPERRSPDYQLGECLEVAEPVVYTHTSSRVRPSYN